MLITKCHSNKSTANNKKSGGCKSSIPKPRPGLQLHISQCHISCNISIKFQIFLMAIEVQKICLLKNFIFYPTVFIPIWSWFHCVVKNMKSTKTQIKTTAHIRQCLFTHSTGENPSSKLLHFTAHSLLNAFIHHFFYIKLNSIVQRRSIEVEKQWRKSTKDILFLIPQFPSENIMLSSSVN